jgi:hypothetical protein
MDVIEKDGDYVFVPYPSEEDFVLWLVEHDPQGAIEYFKWLCHGADLRAESASEVPRSGTSDLRSQCSEH